MNFVNSKEAAVLQRKVLCVALAAIFTTPVMAEEDDEVIRLIKPESQISFGIGHVSGDNQRFGVYNGLNQEGTIGLFNFNVNRRNDETGVWFRASGRNIGLQNQEARLEHEKQGDWGYFLDYNQITRNTPYDIYTRVGGLGSNRLTVPTVSTPSTAPVTFKTERQNAKLGFNKFFTPELEFRLVFQNEEKDGRRLFGRGTGSTQEFLAEPINSTIRQLDAILNYTGDSLQLSGGYYGSFYQNHNSVLQVSGGNAAFNSGVGSLGVAQDNISLPPDNSAHQFHLAGGYQFTGTTRASFKVAKTRAVQDDSFMAVRFWNTANNGANANTSGRTDLGGRHDTTLAQVGITSRPLPGLFLLANYRYEDREDKTAVTRYATTLSGNGASPVLSDQTATSSTSGYNEPRSITNRSGKLEASYQLPEGFRITGGVDVDQKQRTTAGVRVVGYREKTDETTYRLEVKRSMAESLTGSLAYLHSDRKGSDYKNLVTYDGTTNYPNYSALTCGATIPAAGLQVSRCGLLQPIYLADRERDKIRLTLDWAPMDNLSTQFVIEDARDDYGNGRGRPDIGVRRGDARLFSVDVSYILSENWKLSSWISHVENRMDQSTLATPTSNAAVTLWSANQRNVVDSYAIGFRGKLLSGRVDVGGDYIFADDRFRYGLAKENAGTAAVNPLPDIVYKQTTLKLFSRYNQTKDLAFRLDYIYDLRKARDWTWAGYTYSDGTQLVQHGEDRVHFVGISAIYTFR